MSEPTTAADVTVGVRLLHPAASVPGYAHPGDAGADLTTVEDVTLGPGERRLVRTGLMIVLPDGYAGFVHPRSGLAARHGLTIVNAPGTIDAGYRGEILVCLLNTDREQAIALRAGDRIAQLVVQRVETAQFPILADGDDVAATARGTGGYGSTGGFG